MSRYKTDPPKKKLETLSKLEKADRALRRSGPFTVSSSIKESFQWMVPEFETIPVGSKTVKVKGIALPGDIISKNKRQYLESELIRAARTLSGKKFTVNHQDDNIIGNVIHAEYEDGAIEYLAQIKNAEYAEMLRSKDPTIKGVSVQAGYLRLECSKCGERFYGEESWRHHMKHEHGIVDGVKEVHGIIFDALSLVTEPEIPGVANTTIQIAETDKTIMRLCETVMEEKGYSLRPVGNVGVSKDVGLADKKLLGEPFSGYASMDDCIAKNSDEEDPAAYCASIQAKAEGETEDACPEGQYRNSDTGECEPIKDKSTEECFRRLRLLEIRVGQRESDYAALETLNEKFLAYQKQPNGKEAKEQPQSPELDKLSKALGEIEKKLDKHVKVQRRVSETEALTTRIDNLEAKLKGQFKGQNRPLEKQAETYASRDPPKKKS